jgi:hypothetical protein
MGDTPRPTQEVFISYANANKGWALAACAVLEGRGIRCWIAPRNISPGTEWGAAIIEAIDVCRIMVLMFSGQANESPQVRREVERAVSKGLIVFPCRVEDAQPVGAMEYALSNTHWLDVFTPPVEEQMNRLADSVQALLAPEQVARKPADPGSARPGPKQVRPVTVTEAERLEKARQVVRIPGIAMLARSSFSLARGLYLFPPFQRPLVLDGPNLSLILATVAIVAAINVLTLRRHWLCSLGCFAVMPAGGYFCLVGIPVGIWVFQTLRLPGMRESFQRNAERLRNELAMTSAD